MTPAERVMAQCDQLAAFSEHEDALCRRYLTVEHQQANQQVAQWMQEAGMRVWQDAAGNQWGRYPADAPPERPVVILGSHLDTVNNAGKYDGMLGVLSAIEVVRQLHQDQSQLPFAIEVVGFGDEEGVRFGATLLGSAAVTGQWQQEWFALTDAQGIALSEAMLQFGLDPEQIASCAREHSQVQAYLELHIEQGPVLEQAGQAVGIVSAIAGAKRFQFSLTGMAGHAGTVPMNLRRDALCGAAQMVGAIEMAAWEHHVVATVGKLEAHPGAVNVIPGAAEFTLDLRAKDDERLEKALEAILLVARRIADGRQLALDVQLIHEAQAVSCDAQLQAALASTLEQQGYKPHSLLSGAGHDAMMMANIAPVGMLFVRCKGGISHHPAESVSLDDVQAGIDALKGWVQVLAN